MARDDLTDKQKAFIREYLKDPNATQAAIKAGYSAKNADKIGSELLGKTRVAAALDQKFEKLEEKALVSAEYVLTRLKEVAERCLQAEPVMEFDREAKGMVQAVDPDTGMGIYEFDSSGANKALELLGKHIKLFTDKIEVGVDESTAALLNDARARRDKLKG